MTFVYKI